MFDPDQLINDAFDDFAQTAPTVQPAGPDEVRTTVRRRKALRATALSVIAAIAIGVPVTAYAVTPHGGQGPPAVAPAASTSAPAITVTTTPSEASSPQATSSPSASATPQPPDGRITIGQLTSGSVAIPKWTNSVSGACKSGKQHLHQSSGEINHSSNLGGGLGVSKVVYADLDSDSATETAALITCQYGEAATDQVVAFDRDSSGHIVTIGKITEGVIWSLKPSSAGVIVDISDYEACCETPKMVEVHQNRTYGWDGARYVQEGGPTTFMSHPEKNTYTIKVTNAVWSSAPYTPKNSGEVRDLKLTVSIKNTGAYRSQQILVWDNSGFTNLGAYGPAVKLAPALNPGANETVTLTIQWPTDMQNNMNVTMYELGSIKFQSDGFSPFFWTTYDLPS